MELSSEWIEYTSSGEPVDAYLTRAAGVRERLPGVVVIQEVWGVDAHIRDVADRFAAAGYVTLAPDLYSHGGRPQQLASERVEEAKAFFDTLAPAAAMDPSQRAEALAQLPPESGRAVSETLDALLSPERPLDRFLADVRAAFTRLREDPACDGRVASIGFCLGGGLSAQLACEEPALTGAILFYGAPPAPRADPGHRMPGARDLRRAGRARDGRRSRLRFGDARCRQGLRGDRLRQCAARLPQRHAHLLHAGGGPRRLGAGARLPRSPDALRDDRRLMR